jgi:dihydroorotate dehydrogenase (fumarate)
MRLNFDPPLLNSANPWATTRADLQALYDCPYTGAITTRTSVEGGFGHNDTIHQYCFFDDKDHIVKHHSVKGATQGLIPRPEGSTSSLNTLGYSPISAQLYLDIVSSIIRTSKNPKKPVIFSVTGTPKEIVSYYRLLWAAQDRLTIETAENVRFLMETNLSCPNIAGKPPPAYSKAALLEYLNGLIECLSDDMESMLPLIGIKLPPYTYQTQFDEIISALLESCQGRLSVINFITATNTLGNCLVLDSSAFTPAISSSTGTGIGGLAGSALHPLALGNVATLRRMLDAHKELKNIEIIGVGGVSDIEGFERMRMVGASAVAVGTALGAEGLGVFEKIYNGH